MKRKKKTLDEYIEAGAYYRIWKEVALEHGIYLANFFGKGKSKDIISAIETTQLLDSRVGFEDNFFKNYPEIDKTKGCGIFHGHIGAKRHNDIDNKERKIMISILENMIKKIKED